MLNVCTFILLISTVGVDASGAQIVVKLDFGIDQVPVYIVALLDLDCQFRYVTGDARTIDAVRKKV